MSLIRPEVRAGLFRWREVLVGALALGLGLRLVATSFGAVFLIGCGLALAGAALIVAGVQRARFRSGGGGAGVVDIDERQITYFGPFGGGAVAVDDLIEIGVDPSRSWLVRDSAGTHLLIPMNAEGAEALFDAFSALPGLPGARLVEAARSAPREYTIVWAKPQGRLH
ncbi:MAG: hypothetical protein KJO67_04825 [Silicimonas sp.]|nr:hypothetical protein [Silicimonas sp.]NND22580.1 hypothetical protein [Silicimonas sp.]NNL35956.1 hypothetical protein [Silicimonas sp.]RZW11461.1 MAG: hypothetical protein EX266_02510 [Paracoccaceae bacterium]